jgi:GPH family glycoside/pentoside/hexuronide:cation symporter
MSNTTTVKQKVPMGQKIAFGLGMLANQMFPAMLGIFIVVLVENLGFPGWMLGLIYFAPKLFDTFTDPIMGFISDNTKSKWGRRRQYVIVGSIIMAVSFAVMWQLYADNGLNFNFAYFMFWSFAFYLGLTIFGVPYVAMGYEMSDDFHERTTVMATAQLIGQLAWVIAPWFWVLMADRSLFAEADIAVRTLAIYVAIACGILALIPGIFIKSKSTLNEAYTPMTWKNIGSSFNLIIQGFKEAFKIKSFRQLCIATLLIFNAFQTIAGFSYFIIKYYLFAGGDSIWPTLFGSIGAIITTVAVIPIVAQMSKKMGKKKAFILSQSISIIGYILLWFLFVPGKAYLFLFALPFFSFGIGSLFTLMMSMTSDVIDIDELNTNKRREGMFGAIYWWMVKFGTAIAGLFSGIILSIVGFESGAAVQSEETMTGLRFFFSGLPILGTSIAMYVMRDYEVTEEKSAEISAILSARKESKIEAPSFYQINKLQNLTTLSATDKLSSDVDFSKLSQSDIRTQFNKSFQKGLHGLCFGAYTKGQTAGDQLSQEQITRRIDIIAPHTKWVRSFSCNDGHEFIPIAAKAKGLKTMVGAWISSDKAKNESELANLIKLGKEGKVDIAVVGNEVLLRNELTEEELLDYIYRLKRELPSISVGYVDAYYQFHERPKLADACDLILANCYPFWEGYGIAKATVYLEQMYDLAKRAGKGKQVIVTETGWPNAGEHTNQAIPSEENSIQYFVNAQSWATANSIELFHFSSFDESWKVTEEGNVGDQWGLWNQNEELKYQ